MLPGSWASAAAIVFAAVRWSQPTPLPAPAPACECHCACPAPAPWPAPRPSPRLASRFSPRPAPAAPEREAGGLLQALPIFPVSLAVYFGLTSGLLLGIGLSGLYSCAARTLRAWAEPAPAQPAPLAAAYGLVRRR